MSVSVTASASASVSDTLVAPAIVKSRHLSTPPTSAVRPVPFGYKGSDFPDNPESASASSSTTATPTKMGEAQTSAAESPLQQQQDEQQDKAEKASPGRSSSLSRRKPVPNYLIMPNASLPSSHPFASQSPTRANHVHGHAVPNLMARDGSSSSMPGTPHEVDLFYSPPRRNAPPPPPRRTQSGVGIPKPPHREGSVRSETIGSDRTATPPPHSASKTISLNDNDELARTPTSPSRPSTFHDGLNISVSVPVPAKAVATATASPEKLITHAQVLVSGETRQSRASSVASSLASAKSSRSIPNPNPNRTHDRPLPPVPRDASLDLSSALDMDPEEFQAMMMRRSVSTDSPTAPTTPATPVFVRGQSPSVPWPGNVGTAADGLTQSSSLSSSSAPKANKVKKSSKRSKKAGESKAEPRRSMLPGGEPEEDETFSVHRPPSKRRLWEAGTCFVRDEDGNQVCFGDLFPRWPDATATATTPPGAAAGDAHEKMETALTALSRPPPKTVVFFIRTFWCGQCQDYTFASLGLLDREAIEKQNIRVVVISNGSWKIIKAYRKLFNCPFPIYVDASLKLYHLLGMKSSRDFGHWYKGRAAYHQRSVPSQIVTGIKNGLVNMPLANFGNVAQLGGEFILEPGYVCSWVSRMTTRSNHVEAPEVLRIAGVAHPTSTEVQEIKFAEDQRVELERLQAEMKEWRQNREAELERIRRRKAARRGEAYVPAPKRLSAVMGLDEELGELDPEMESGYIMGPNGEFIPLDTSERGSVRGSVRLAAMIEEEGEGEEEEEEDGGEEEYGGEEEEAAAQADKDELDRRFAEVMRIEEERMKQRHAAAGGLVVAEGHGVQVTQ